MNHGQIDVDQSALTGESLPVTFYAGDSAKMGSTVTRGEVEGTVEVSVLGQQPSTCYVHGCMVQCMATDMVDLHSSTPESIWMLSWYENYLSYHYPSHYDHGLGLF